MRSYSEDVADAVIQGLTILIFEKQLFCLHGSQISLNARKTKNTLQSHLVCPLCLFHLLLSIHLSVCESFGRTQPTTQKSNASRRFYHATYLLFKEEITTTWDRLAHITDTPFKTKSG